MKKKKKTNQNNDDDNDNNINSKLSEKGDSVVYVLLKISKKCNTNPKLVIFRDFAKRCINIEDIIEDTINYIDSLVKEDCILEGL